MKLLTILFAFLLTLGCKDNGQEVIVIEPVSDIVAKIPDNMPVAVEDNVTVPVVDPCDRLRKHNDSLIKELFIAQYKINRVKYYLAIVRRKPSQSKFLRGWVIRAVK